MVISLSSGSKRRPASPRRWLLAGVMVVCLCAPAVASASAVRLTAGFGPAARLGSDTELRIGLRVDLRQASSPVAAIHLLYPSSLGVATSGLGVATCRRAELEAHGLAACSPNSVMGRGSVLVQARPFTSIREAAQITVLAGPPQHGHFALLFYADGESPAGVQLVDAGAIAPAGSPFGGDLFVENLEVIPGIEGITVALMQMRFTLGPRDLIYYEASRRKRPYRPEGIILPNTCPRRGFSFQADLTLEDHSRITATTTAPCPPDAPHAR